METIVSLLRAIRAVLSYCHDPERIESHRAVTNTDACTSERRMKGISDSYKALLLASPGR
jgi:hypothetical protein